MKLTQTLHRFILAFVHKKELLKLVTSFPSAIWLLPPPMMALVIKVTSGLSMSNAEGTLLGFLLPALFSC
jgi:hypothetical protein